jgi:NADPH:quinone reductase-like Zn-dependent oxidoreductase
VLVRVHAASVDRGTWHIMTGRPYLIRAVGFGLRMPKARNPGRSFAGTIAACGKEVRAFEAGDAVYGTCDASFAEYARGPRDRVARKPVNLSYEEAAACPISGVTALQAVRDKARVQVGQSVLVVGASGGVGTFAVQIAKAFGATVTGVCSTGKMDLVNALGADHVIDYTVQDFSDGPRRYDVVLDIGGNSSLSHLRRAMTPHGTLVIVGGETDGRWLGGFDRQIRALMVSPMVSQKLGTLASSENATDLMALTELLESGNVTPVIDQTYELQDVAKALERMTDGQARGKIVVTI